MNFYGLNYLKSQSNLNDYVKYGLIFGSLILLVVVFSLYLKYRLQTKYRDLSIIFFLILIFALGVQYSDYQSSQAKYSQSSQMVHFIEQVAKDQEQPPQKVFVNATQLADGVLVKVDQKYYRVNLNGDQSSYNLSAVKLLSDTVKINK